MEREGIRYELRTIEDTDYNSHADVRLWYFDNGMQSPTSPAGHSEARRFSPGTTVLCRLRRSTSEKGYYMEGFAEVTEFSKDGRPINFGQQCNNLIQGRWEPPVENEKIHEGRASFQKSKERK
ncbi:MAG: hypothetical protein ABIJ05_00385 [Patescibacteria group bacterium]